MAATPCDQMCLCVLSIFFFLLVIYLRQVCLGIAFWNCWEIAKFKNLKKSFNLLQKKKNTLRLFISWSFCLPHLHLRILRLLFCLFSTLPDFIFARCLQPKFISFDKMPMMSNPDPKISFYKRKQESKIHFERWFRECCSQERKLANGKFDEVMGKEWNTNESVFNAI